jgi:bile acid:Na+ symporter, BASS family
MTGRRLKKVVGRVIPSHELSSNSRPVTMTFDTTAIIRLLTMGSLGGLLFAVGLRLNWRQVVDSIRGSHLELILPVNFLLVPLLVFGIVRVFKIPNEISIGMLLLAAAPFAPVVPIFTRFARGNLALAGTLTALFPFFSVLFTPLICKLTLRPFLGTGTLKFNLLMIFITLFSTITLPLVVGLAFKHYLPAFASKVLRPLEIISEAAGAISLTFVTVVEFRIILTTGLKPLMAMILACELSLVVGYVVSGPSIETRRVMALGTSNRNIALALLIALQSFPGTPIIAAVVANGLVLIFLGLLHVAYWRVRTGHEQPN